jgi:tape measure domain-containing protein
MPSVDDRIVRMEFDNAAFERKLDTTIASLGKLEKALRFDGAKQGLSDVSSSISRFNMGNMGTVIEGVSSKFLALATIAVTALTRITNMAISTGIQLAKSLSLDQIISGFQEYEMNMNSIQTILSNTKADGTNLGQVNDALAELNRYADQTIYNFGQMTKNIGTFTAAGVDLNTSVQSIKGISNLAAISGSSAEQASSAMYQLSQAVSTGTLRLQDWNSVVNAGMGGEVFQKALFETGKALKTIKDVPMKQTFEQWKDAGNSFRGSLESEWLTAEVLTTTLQGFTGEMTEAQLTAIGYTKQQAAEIIELGKTGVEAATKVRTLTGLIATTKEQIGSGWSESFKIVFGNFEEATTLFTGISTAIGKMVDKSSKARNELLQGWKDIGGRDLLINAFKTAAENLGKIIKPIQQAFRDIFPPLTAERLYNLTRAFSVFADKLKPSWETMDRLKRIFKGFFALLEIGWTVIKEGVRFVKDLIDTFTGLGEGKVLSFMAKIGDFFIKLNDQLVEGRAITRFFMNLKDILGQIPEFLTKVKDGIVAFFSGADLNLPDQVGDSFGRLGDRFAGLKDLFEKAADIWKPVQKGLEMVLKVLDQVWEAIKTWFQELGTKMADAAEEGDFQAVLDALNTALLGGIVGMLAKFIKEGFTFDIGEGLFGKISKSFEELTGVLKAMQTDIKANALLKIAGAVAILAAAVVALSLIDSEALTKALTAMAIGFAQLMGAFAILTKISAGPKGAASFVLIASGMTIMAGAILILAGAAAILGNLNWEELAKGLGAIIVLMGVMVGASKLLSGSAGNLILAGAGMILLATGLSILAGAIKIFATMDWDEMAKGMVGLAGALLIVAGAMQLMPATAPLLGAGLLLLAIGVSILAGALKIFATMSWEEIGKGMAALAGGLLIIAGAMQLISPVILLVGPGLILTAIAINILAGALKIMATMSWEEIGRGLVALAGSLLILAVACNAMTGSIAGAIAIGVVSVSLMVLAKVLKEMAGISWGDLLHGLVGIAAVLATLAVAALLIQPAIPAMLALGAALVVIGAGFALFGFGANLVAQAFETLAKAGSAGAESLEKSLKAIGRSMSALGRGIAEGALEFLQTLADAAPVIAEQLMVILGHIIEGLKTLIPKVIEVVQELVEGIFATIRTYASQLIETGLFIITTLLQGISDNIGTVVTLVGTIITNFLDAFAAQVPIIVSSLVDLYITIFETVAFELGRAVPTILIGVGVGLITGLWTGIMQATGPVGEWFMNLAGTVFNWIGNTASKLWEKGWGFIEGLWKGIDERVTAVANWFKNLANTVFGWIGNVARKLWSIGRDFIGGLWDGITERVKFVFDWFKGLGDKIRNAIPNPLSILYNVGRDFVQGLKNGIESAWNGLTSWLGDKVEGLKDFITNPFGIFSPSKVTMYYGEMIMAGLQIGMEEEWKNVEKWMAQLNPTESLTKSVNNAIADMTSQLDTIEEFNPVITPVLDLTRIQQDAKQISTFMGASRLTPTFSTAQANVIATSSAQQDVDTAQGAPGGVNFEQNIYAPTRLSTADIYKQTRNQIALAKEELNIV